jgi:predicted phage-related endonuclease
MSKCYIAVQIGLSKPIIYKEILFDKELFDKLVEKAKKFWEVNVKQDIAPDVIGIDNNVLIELYPKNVTDELIHANKEIEEAVRLRQELSGHKSEIDAQIKDLDARIKAVIGDNSGILTQRYKITWNNQKRKGVDTQALKDAGLYSQYCKETEIRMLKFSLRKPDKTSIEKLTEEMERR